MIRTCAFLLVLLLVGGCRTSQRQRQGQYCDNLTRLCRTQSLLHIPLLGPFALVGDLLCLPSDYAGNIKTRQFKVVDSSGAPIVQATVEVGFKPIRSWHSMPCEPDSDEGDFLAQYEQVLSAQTDGEGFCYLPRWFTPQQPCGIEVCSANFKTRSLRVKAFHPGDENALYAVADLYIEEAAHPVACFTRVIDDEAEIMLIVLIPKNLQTHQELQQ